MLRALIADDHPVVLKGISGTLRENFEGITIDEVGRGYGVINKVNSCEYDFAILSISLPDIDGLEVLAAVRKKNSRLPVLMISIHPEEHYAVRAIKAGAQGYLTKRSTCDELVRAVRKILSGKRYVNPSFAEKMIFEFESNTERPPHEKLSNREFQVACMIGKGKTMKEITEELRLSMNTVRTYRARVLEKMGVKATNELIRYAVQHSLVE